MRNMFVALLMLAASPAIAQDKEKLSATDLTVRTALTFKVADSAVQKLLPAGFELNSPTAGPSKGSNLNVTLIDYLMVQDPEGKPLPPRSTIAMSVPAKKIATGEGVAVVFGGFIPQAGVPGPYSVFGSAKITVDRRSRTDADGKSYAERPLHRAPSRFGTAKINIDRRSRIDADGKSIIEESWEAIPDDGGALAIQLQFTRGDLARSKAAPKIHSAAKPDFYRIYQFEQAADVVRSAPSGIDRVSKLSIKATGPRLAPLFDGSEQLISITSIPFYSRSIFVPAT